MDVLLIESDALRRVSVAHHLSRSGHRATISVAIAEALLSSDSTCFRNEIADRFPHAAWIPLPANLSLRWLVDSLHKAATRTAPQNTRSISRFQRAPRIPEGERAHLLVVQGDRDNFDERPKRDPESR